MTIAPKERGSSGLQSSREGGRNAEETFTATLSWVWNNAQVLFWCWLIPITKSRIADYDAHQRAGARALAIAGVVLLTFLIRSFSDDASGSRYTYAAVSAIVAGLAGVVAAIIDFGAKLIVLKIRERVILSGLASTLLMMIFYIAIYLGPGSAGWVWYNAVARALGEYGWEIWASVLAAVATLLVWLVASAVFGLRPRNLRGSEIALSLIVVCASGLLVLSVAVVPEGIFGILAKR